MTDENGSIRTTPSEEEVWRLFRDQRERCATCHVRIKWEERDVRGRSGGWILAEQDGKLMCVCFKCADHRGPKLQFHLSTSET